MVLSGCVGAVPSTFPTMRVPSQSPPTPNVPSPSGSPSSTPTPSLPSPQTTPSIPQPPSTSPSMPTPTTQPSLPTRPTSPTVRQGSEGGRDRSSNSESGQQDSRSSRSGGGGATPSLPGLPQLPPLEPTLESGRIPTGGEGGGPSQMPTGSDQDSSEPSDGWILVAEGEGEARSDSEEGTGDGAGQQGDPNVDPEETEEGKQGPSPDDLGGTKQAGQAGANSPGEVVGPDSEMRAGGGLHGTDPEDEWDTSNELPDPAQRGEEEGSEEEELAQNDSGLIDEELGQVLSVLDGEIQEEREEQNATAGGISEGEFLPSDESVATVEGDGADSSGEDQIVVGGTSTEEIPNPDRRRTGQVEPSELPDRPKATPADIPDAKDDDVIARQLREAAMAETDPKLRESLWEELRVYKGGK